MPCRYNIRPGIVILASFLLLLLFCGCASTGGVSDSGLGELKNSLPLMGKNMIEEVHSIAVPNFYGDRNNWNGVALDALASSQKISVISAEKTDKAIRDSRKDISNTEPEERLEALARIGRALQSDAVLNGVILSRDKQHEIILQLISSRDSRILWWQAVEFRLKEGFISVSEQKALVSKMIGPLLPHIGKKEKPAAATKPQPKSDEQIKFDAQPKYDVPEKKGPRPKSDKKPDKWTKPADISPM